MHRFAFAGLLLAIGVLLAYWGGAKPERSEANPGTPTMQFRVESGASTCTPMVNPTECTVPGTGTFQLAGVVTVFPPDPDGAGPGAAGYSAMTTDIDWTGTGLPYKPTADPAMEIFLPGGTKPGRETPSATRVRHGSLSAGAGGTPSTFKGDVVRITMNCTPGGSSNVVNLLPRDPLTNPFGAALTDSFGTSFSLSDTITINCVPDLDTDSDGCTDLRENGSDPKAGGLRNLQSFWDFYDTPDPSNVRDRIIGVQDVLRVAQRFGTNDAMGTAPINRNSDPLAGPIPTGYHPAFDRGAVNGPNIWDRAPPDGTIGAGSDVLPVARQWSHSCR